MRWEHPVYIPFCFKSSIFSPCYLSQVPKDRPCRVWWEPKGKANPNLKFSRLSDVFIIEKELLYYKNASLMSYLFKRVFRNTERFPTLYRAATWFHASVPLHVCLRLLGMPILHSHPTPPRPICLAKNYSASEIQPKYLFSGILHLKPKTESVLNVCVCVWDPH